MPVLRNRRIWAALALALLVIGIGFTIRGLIAPQIAQRLARHAIVKAGGVVTEERVLAGPGWSTVRVSYVSFPGGKLTDAQFAALLPDFKTLGPIRQLDLSGTQVGDTGLNELAAVERVAIVDVTNSRVTTAGIDRLCQRRPLLFVVDNSGPRAIGGVGCEDLQFSPDGRQLALVARDGVRVMDLAAGSLAATVPGGVSAAFSSDGKLLAVAHVTGALIWDLAANRQLASVPMRDQSSTRVAISSDGGFLFVEEFRATHRYQLTGGQYVDTRPGVLLGRSHNVAGLDFEQSVAAMVDPDTGVLSGTLNGKPGQIRLGVVSGDGRRAAWAEDPAYNGLAFAVIQVIDLTTGSLLNTLTPATNAVLLSGSFDAGGGRLAVGDSSGLVQVYDVASGRVLFSHQDHAGAAIHTALSADGLRVAAAFEYGSVKWWP